MKHLKQILVALAIGALMCGALTGCADAVPEDAPLRDLMEKTEVETQEPDVEKPDDSDSETDSEANKPTESDKETETDSDKDSGSANSSNSSSSNSGSSSSGNTASKPSNGNSGNSKPSGGSGNSGGNSKPAHTTHSWNGGSVTKSPTCSASGTKTYTCTVCGATKQETIGATGNHKWANHTATKQEKYWVDGEWKRQAACSCGATFDNQYACDQHALDKLLAGDANHTSTPYDYQEEGHWAYKDVSYTDYQYCSVCGARK